MLKPKSSRIFQKRETEVLEPRRTLTDRHSPANVLVYTTSKGHFSQTKQITNHAVFILNRSFLGRQKPHDSAGRFVYVFLRKPKSRFVTFCRARNTPGQGTTYSTRHQRHPKAGIGTWQTLLRCTPSVDSERLPKGTVRCGLTSTL